MPADLPLDIFLAVSPGLEDALCEEVRERGFSDPRAEPGGVTVTGGWGAVWRANLEVRGASRVLARIDRFPVTHLAQFDKRMRRFAWTDVLRPDTPVRIEASCRRSRIYHEGAVQERVAGALQAAGIPVEPDAGLRIMVRLDKDICTLSVDTSGELLHRRGYKEAVNRAPIRETLAALFLRQCGYRGDEPVLDPMCGSGTFVIEAAEMAAGLPPGRARNFAFERLAGFDPEAWQSMRGAVAARPTEQHFFGSDRDPGAVRMSRANAERAGVAHLATFTDVPVAELERPAGPAGLVIVNPPYGGRIGNRKTLYTVYAALGATLSRRFSGWRVGLITSDAALARATRLPFGEPGPPVDHGGLKVRLWQTRPLR